ncbi:MAG: SLC13 family permease [Alsobacter sp.]
MTLSQGLALGVLAAVMVLFLWGRLRYDIVAALGLAAGTAVGVVPAETAFSGFSDDIVIIIASALVVSAAIARSGALEAGLQMLAPWLRTQRLQVFALVAAVTALSAFVKNIGALAMLIPLALEMARKGRYSASVLLMPMAFGALLGGLVTLVGTSPNIIVSRLREDIAGKPFAMFDFAPVGLILAGIGIVFLVSFHRLVPERQPAGGGLDSALDIKDYTTEARVAENSEVLGLTMAELNRRIGTDVTVTTLIRASDRRTSPLPDTELRIDDALVLVGDPAALERAVSTLGLKLSRQDKPPVSEEGDDEVGVIEAILAPDGPLVGQSAQRAALFHRHGVNLLAVSRSGQRFTERLRDITLQAGDVLVLQGALGPLPDTLRDLRLLPLAKRTLRLGSVRRGVLAVSILAVAMGATAFGVVPVTVAFAGAALAMVLSGALPLREAYDAVEWPIVVMLAALIPVSDAIRTTGGTDLIAGLLAQAATVLPAWGALALVMVAAMAVTPFLNNAATVLVMAPIAARFAMDLGLSPDAFLMAVAVGAACDFLTPIGHQCNTLVMGPGGYRFSDYWRLGLPLSILVVTAGVRAVLMVWPLGS